MPMGLWKVETDLAFHVSVNELADAVEIDAIIASRMRGLSSDPGNEVAVAIAHGSGGNAENQRWLDKIADRARPAGEQHSNVALWVSRQAARLESEAASHHAQLAGNP